MSEKDHKNKDIDSGKQNEDFEEKLRRLEDIVAELEQGNLPLDKSLRLYEEGISTYKNCRELLQTAETRVLKLVETLEGELEEKDADIPGEEELK